MRLVTLALILAAALPALAGDLEILRAENARLQRELDEANRKAANEVDRDSRIAAKLAQAQADQKKLYDVSQELESTNAELKSERARVNALSKKALSIEGELEKTIAERDALRVKLAEAEQELKDAREHISELDKDLKTARDRIAVLEKQLADALARLKATEDRLAQTEALLAKERELTASQQKRIAELEARIAALEKENGELKGTIAATKDALAELQKRKAEADARIAEFKGLIAKFQKLIDSGKLRVKIVDGRMVVEVATDILFASGSAELSREGKAAVKEVAQILATIPDRKFQIEGHTDNVPMNSERFPSNWELAAGRSINVVKTMLEAGMPKERVSAASFADARPAAANDTSLGKKANRRIEIVVVPDLSSLPGFDELNKVSATPN